ncbi:hypothetical protein QE152_g13883 [Popillia japonica]|uniref:Uncharacterized protein n=1 Tax=Popillia japonica TaxID=7064 RepID=A0AAW1LAZ1_POPJA
MKEAPQTTTTRTAKSRKVWLEKKDTIPYFPNFPLYLIIKTKLTKRCYAKIRLGGRQSHAHIYPSYHNTEMAIGECYPDRTFTVISESTVQVKLQALLNHTVTRRQNPVPSSVGFEDPSTYSIVTKILR